MIQHQSRLKRSPIKKRRSKPRRGRVIDKAYKEWISNLPCLICYLKSFIRWLNGEDGIRWDGEQRYRTEVAHIGIRGLSQKSNDRDTMPACAWHHQEGPESLHKLGKKFWNHHGLDREKVIADLNIKYD